MKNLTNLIREWLNSDEDTNYTFDDIDDGLKPYFKKQLTYLLLGLLFSIIIGIFGSLPGALVLLGFLIIYGLQILLDIKKTFSGEILKINGVFYDYSVESIGPFKRDCYEIMLADQSFVKFYPSKKLSFKENNEISIFTKMDCLRAENEDTVIVSSFIHININKNVSNMTVLSSATESSEADSSSSSDSSSES